MKNKIFFAFNLDDAQSREGRSDSQVSMRLVAAENRHQAKAFLAEHYGGSAWAVISKREIHKGLVHV
jgi:hypothetical protein